MRYAHLVIGTAGCGKSTYCHLMQQHANVIKRSCPILNLDPAAEAYEYDCYADIRELVTVENVMETTDLGPNGGLIYAMEHLMDNIDWLEEKIEAFSDDEYFLIDCPGQIELYTHNPVMRGIVDALKSWDVRICAVYCMDVGFLTDAYRFIAGTLSALSAMIQLELPHVNVLTKGDLVTDDEEFNDILSLRPADLPEKLQADLPTSFKRVNEAIVNLLEDFNLVSFVVLNPNDEDSISQVIQAVDQSIQFGEDEDVRDVDFQ